MRKTLHQDLSRRERQIMNVLYRLGEASVSEIADQLPDAPSETSIRTFLRILGDKRQVKRHREGRRHVYRPAIARKRAARAALSSVLETFFEGSLPEAVAMHLSDPKAQLDPEEIERLRSLVQDATEEDS